MVQWKRRTPWRAAAAAALLAAVLIGAGCAPEKKDELSGPFGPGAGGPAVPQGAVQTLPITTGDGTPIGSLQYDDGYFAQTPVTGMLYVLTNATDNVSLAIGRITGRPDTPCRYDAAIQARDDGYTILASGDRTNANGLEFHQVNLVKGAIEQRFYCTELYNHVGIQIDGISLTAGALDWEQVHFVLNSVNH